MWQAEKKLLHSHQNDSSALIHILLCFDTEKQAWHPKTNTWDMLEWRLLLKESLEST